MAEAATFDSGHVARRARDFARRLELPGDALLFVYFAVFARQYLWWVAGGAAAWAAAWASAALACYLYVSTKEVLEQPPFTRDRLEAASDSRFELRPESNLRSETASKRRLIGRARPLTAGAGLPFWLLVVAPLAFVYSMRAVFPDVSFDVLNYRLLHAERALGGFVYLPEDFFPTPAPYNPAPDMVTGLARRALGYRLGTVVNLLALVWAGRVADKLLRPYLRGAWLRAAGVLLVVLSEHLLFEINNYMADLLALPLTLEATYLALHAGASEDESGATKDERAGRRNLVRVALLLGMSVAFKLTNVAMALPVVLYCAYRAVLRGRHGARSLALATLHTSLAFAAPLLPFSVYLYRLTGSPVFPVFNGVFKSAYWPPDNVWDPRWGPSGVREGLLWPVLCAFHPGRLSELSVYTGRISVGFVAALAGLLWPRGDARLRALCFITALGCLLWSASTGYVRYAFPVEVLSGVVVLAHASAFARRGGPRARWHTARASLLWLALAAQAAFACVYVSRNEWAGRPTFFTRPDAYALEAAYLLRDYSLKDFLPAAERARFDGVGVWVGSGAKAAGLEVLLNGRAPVLGVRTPQFFVNRRGREEFERALERVGGRRMFSLAFAEDEAEARAALRSRGLAAGSTVPLRIPFHSPHTQIGVVLFEVARAGTDRAGGTGPPPAGVDSSTLPDGAYDAEISASHQPAVMRAGAAEVLRLAVRNAGTGAWPSRVREGWKYVVTVGDRWLDADGVAVVNDTDGRAALPRDLAPGDAAEVTLSVNAPRSAGLYVLEIDLVHEGVTWFQERGSKTLRWQVRVEP